MYNSVEGFTLHFWCTERAKFLNVITIFIAGTASRVWFICIIATDKKTNNTVYAVFINIYIYIYYIIYIYTVLYMLYIYTNIQYDWMTLWSKSKRVSLFHINQLELQLIKPDNFKKIENDPVCFGCSVNYFKNAKQPFKGIGTRD